MRAAKTASDRVVVRVHWGVLWCCLPDNQGLLAEYRQPLGRRLVDAGADVVVGTHPHCRHPAQMWNDGLIIYSAGNFLFHTAEITAQEVYFGLPYQSSRRFCGPWFDSGVFKIDLHESATDHTDHSRSLGRTTF